MFWLLQHRCYRWSSVRPMQFKHSQQFRGQPHQQIENQKLQTYYAFMGQCRNKQIPTDEVNMNFGYKILLGFPGILFYRYIHNTHTILKQQLKLFLLYCVSSIVSINIMPQIRSTLTQSRNKHTSIYTCMHIYIYIIVDIVFHQTPTLYNIPNMEPKL